MVIKLSAEEDDAGDGWKQKASGTGQLHHNVANNDDDADDVDNVVVVSLPTA